MLDIDTFDYKFTNYIYAHHTYMTAITAWVFEHAHFMYKAIILTHVSMNN